MAVWAGFHNYYHILVGRALKKQQGCCIVGFAKILPISNHEQKALFRERTLIDFVSLASYSKQIEMGDK